MEIYITIGSGIATILGTFFAVKMIVKSSTDDDKTKAVELERRFNEIDARIEAVKNEVHSFEREIELKENEIKEIKDMLKQMSDKLDKMFSEFNFCDNHKRTR